MTGVLRVIVAQLRRRPGRAVALGAGILVAATSFALLTAVVRSSKAETVGTVNANARSAYDVLVRPPRTTTALERDRGLVEGNFLSGIFGGITTAQSRAIAALPQVDVAAPIANLGYVPVLSTVDVDVSRFLRRGAPAELLRLRPRLATASGTYPMADQYVYLTRVKPIAVVGNPGGGYFELQREDRRYWVCWYYNMDPQGLTGKDGSPLTGFEAFDLAGRPRTPYSPAVRSQLTCQAGRDRAVARIPVAYPVLLSAVDPVAEDRLVGLRRAVTSGRMLTPRDRPYWHHDTAEVDGVDQQDLRVPVLLADRATSAGTISATVETLDGGSPARIRARLGSPGARAFLKALPGRRAGVARADLAGGFVKDRRQLLGAQWSAGNLLTVGPIAYRRDGDGRLHVRARPPQGPRVWWDQIQRAWLPAPEENTGPQYRTVTGWPSTDCMLKGSCSQIDPGRGETPLLKFVGRYDAAKVRSFGALSTVPMETYASPDVTIDGRRMGPDRNLGGYVAQPPAMLTTLASAGVMAASRHAANPRETAPISAIRIRVLGVHGVDAVSRARVNAAVAAIHRVAPRLEVDVTIGSSPSLQTIVLPSGQEVSEAWTSKGVALRILRAVDAKSATLFGLVLVVCGLFLTQAALASVRARRGEIGILRTMGWSAREVFGAVLGELVVVGAVAGGLGALVVWTAGAAHAGLVLPVALGLALAAGLGPAWRATRLRPMDAIRPPVTPAGRARPVRSVAGLAARNLRRMRGRTVLGAAGLTLGVAALTVLLAVTLAFHGEVTGSLLGGAVIAHARAADYLSVALSLLLGAAGAVDVLVLSQRERAGDLAVLRASGWSTADFVRLTLYEGLGLALLGGITGSALGLAVVSALGSDVLAGRVLSLLAAGALGTVAAVLLTGAMLTIPIRRLNAIAPSRLLAGE